MANEGGAQNLSKPRKATADLPDNSKREDGEGSIRFVALVASDALPPEIMTDELL